MDSHREGSQEIEEILELVNNSDLSSIKSVVSSLMEIINDPEATAKDLREIIEVDPPLTAKLLRIVNSPYYSLPRKISEITEAIILMGFDALKQLVLNQKVCEIFMGDEHLNGYSRPSLWKHSVGVALLGQMICRREFRQRGENAYAAGLLHDLGIIVEDQFLHDQLKHILQKSHTEKGNLSVAECGVLGYDHAEIGMAVAANWGLPQDLVMTLGYHHKPDKAPITHRRFTSILYVADRLCQDNGVGYSDHPHEDGALFQASLEDLNLDPSGLDLIFEDVKQEISRMEEGGLL